MIIVIICGYTVIMKGTAITSTVANAAARQEDEWNKEVIFESAAPFMDCINEINNTQVDNVKDQDVVMPMYNLIEYNDIIIKKHLSVYGNITEMNQMLLYYSRFWIIQTLSKINKKHCR